MSPPPAPLATGATSLLPAIPVNVASRLQSLAEPGTVLVGPRTHRATSGAVRYRALPNTTIRGKSRALKVWEALEMTAGSAVPAPRPRGLDGLRAPLVGRDVELELMDALFDRVRSERRPHLVTILGAPGVGKTRLAREFIQRALGAPALLSSNLMEDAAAASNGPNASNPAARRPLSPAAVAEAAEMAPTPAGRALPRLWRGHHLLAAGGDAAQLLRLRRARLGRGVVCAVAAGRDRDAAPRGQAR